MSFWIILSTSSSVLNLPVLTSSSLNSFSSTGFFSATLEGPEYLHRGRELAPLAYRLAEQDSKVSLGLGLGVGQDVLDHPVHERYRHEGVLFDDLFSQHQPRPRAREPDERLQCPRRRAYLSLNDAPPQLQVVLLQPVLGLCREFRGDLLSVRDVLLHEVELYGRRLGVTSPSCGHRVCGWPASRPARRSACP